MPFSRTRPEFCFILEYSGALMAHNNRFLHFCLFHAIKDDVKFWLLEFWKNPVGGCWLPTPDPGKAPWSAMVKPDCTALLNTCGPEDELAALPACTPLTATPLPPPPNPCVKAELLELPNGEPELVFTPKPLTAPVLGLVRPTKWTDCIGAPPKDPLSAGWTGGLLTTIRPWAPWLWEDAPPEEIAESPPLLYVGLYRASRSRDEPPDWGRCCCWKLESAAVKRWGTIPLDVLLLLLLLSLLLLLFTLEFTAGMTGNGDWVVVVVEDGLRVMLMKLPKEEEEPDCWSLQCNTLKLISCFLFTDWWDGHYPFLDLSDFSRPFIDMYRASHSDDGAFPGIPVSDLNRSDFIIMTQLALLKTEITMPVPSAFDYLRESLWDYDCCLWVLFRQGLQNEHFRFFNNALKSSLIYMKVYNAWGWIFLYKQCVFI